MNSDVRTLIVMVLISVVLWLLGGFVFNHTFGIISVFVSICLVGWAAGKMMDSPCTTSGLGKKQ